MVNNLLIVCLLSKNKCIKLYPPPPQDWLFIIILCLFIDFRNLYDEVIEWFDDFCTVICARRAHKRICENLVESFVILNNVMWLAISWQCIHKLKVQYVLVLSMDKGWEEGWLLRSETEKSFPRFEEPRSVWYTLDYPKCTSNFLF